MPQRNDPARRVTATPADMPRKRRRYDPVQARRDAQKRRQIAAWQRHAAKAADNTSNEHEGETR